MNLPKAAQQALGAPLPITAPAPLYAAALQGQSTRLVVSFSGVGKKSYERPAFEFTGTASAKGQNHALFIGDEDRTWMTAPRLVENIVTLVEDYAKEHGISEIVTLGNSMGGFMALRIAENMRVDTAIAFAPQYSIHVDTMPEETRWQAYRDQITDWPIRDIGALSIPDTQYFVFHGDDPIEAQHWLRFPQRKNIHHFIVAGESHGVAGLLRNHSGLGRVIKASANQKPRQVRLVLERSLAETNCTVLRREAYHQHHPDLRLGCDGFVTSQRPVTGDET